jgi:hypothetical protein
MALSNNGALAGATASRTQIPPGEGKANAARTKAIHDPGIRGKPKGLARHFPTNGTDLIIPQSVELTRERHSLSQTT